MFGLNLTLPRKSSRHYPWLAVGTVCVGAFMAALDASIVNVAMPTLLTHFHGGIHRVEWVSVAYLLTLTSLLAVFGKLSDLLGRKTMYTLGFGVFIIGSALCGLAPHLPYLVSARILQAAGAAMLQANSVAIVTSSVSKEQRGRAIGIQGSAQAVGLSVGPAIGGVLVSHWGWQSIFYVNVPIGIIGTIMGIFLLPPDVKGKRFKFDFVGAALLTVGLIFALLVLTDGSKYGWTSSSILLYAVVAIVSLVLLSFWVRRIEDPVVDPKILRLPVFWRGNVAGLLSYALMYGVLFLLPFFFEHVQRMAPYQSGFLLTPVPIAMALVTPFAGVLADKIAVRKLTSIGMGLAVVGTLLFVLLKVETPAWFVVLALLLVGLGIGVFTPANNSHVMGTVAKERLGVAGGLLNMSRSLGMSFGIAFSGAVFQAAENEQATSLFGYRLSFFFTAVLGLISILMYVTAKKAKNKQSAS